MGFSRKDRTLACCISQGSTKKQDQQQTTLSLCLSLFSIFIISTISSLSFSSLTLYVLSWLYLMLTMWRGIKCFFKKMVMEKNWLILYHSWRNFREWIFYICIAFSSITYVSVGQSRRFEKQITFCSSSLFSLLLG